MADNKLCYFIEKKKTNLPYLIKCVASYFKQDHVKRPGGCPNSQWIQCIGGAGVLYIDHKKIEISSGTGMFIRAGVPHEYYGTSHPWEVALVSFDGYGVNPLLDVLGFENYGVFKLEQSDFINQMIKKMYRTVRQDAQDASYKISKQLYEFLMALFVALNKKQIIEKNPNAIKVGTLVNYLEENYSKEITIEDMAQYIAMSKQHLCRIFKNEIGMRPFEYLTDIRIRESKRLLLDERDLKVYEIAKKVGYKDQSYYGATFKSLEGMTPGEYRILNVY